MRKFKIMIPVLLIAVIVSASALNVAAQDGGPFEGRTLLLLTQVLGQATTYHQSYSVREFDLDARALKGLSSYYLL